MNRTTAWTSIRPSATYLNTYSYINSYRTVNNFNGGELGLNAVYTHGRWSLDVVGKAAIGVNNQYVRLYNQGTIDMSNATGIGTPPIPANTTPLQEFSRNQFSAIPELTVTAGYQVTDHLKVTVGYDCCTGRPSFARRIRSPSSRRPAIPMEPCRATTRAAGVHLERVVLLRPGLASGRGTAVLSSRGSTRKRAGNRVVPCPFLCEGQQPCVTLSSCAEGLSPGLSPDSIDQQAGDARAQQHEVDGSGTTANWPPPLLTIAHDSSCRQIDAPTSGQLVQGVAFGIAGQPGKPKADR